MYCVTIGPCFARKNDGNCKILTRCYDAGKKCPFQKEKKNYTNGVYYPYIPPNTCNKKESIESERTGANEINGKGRREKDSC